MIIINEFRHWTPANLAKPKAIIVLTPPSQSDGRYMVDDRDWQHFAKKQNCALVGCYFQDISGPFEDYCDVRHRDSGEKLIAYIRAHYGEGEEKKIPKLLFWGFSAGGQFNYEFACRYPELVAGFVVNKGGVYYTGLAPEATRKIPALWCIGALDSEWRQHMLLGILSLNRVAGAQWLRLIEKTGHAPGTSDVAGRTFFKGILEGMK